MAFPNPDPVWFITGSSSGFGRELTKAVLERGWRVAATARDPATLQEFAESYPERVEALALDVTHAGQIDAAVRQAQRRFGRIDVLVNNAGYGLLSAVEEADIADVRAIFETNMFGLFETTRAVLPVMRRQGGGQIVTMSSIGGLQARAGTGYYSATKYAVEGFSESLWHEVRPLGIEVMIVEPGSFQTDFSGRSIKQTSTPLAAYEQTAGARRREILGRSGKKGRDPSRAAQVIIDVLGGDDVPLRLLLGPGAVAMARAKLRAMSEAVERWAEVSCSTG
ncbi:oxidoreductase [Sphingobium fuliginis]|uniref:SDR family NAD(P)-dependent oxidoreductase n=1 Tax=Sphingobium fuliginis ATCC 27551 TaxID=1208342 RepID=A0A5B8CED8_SPHSA|nr:oxidoreductase [Sphingobium fuliginis]QDC37245.1 SDR family NAD(P)-dependent oxidoreductase [Sphingobium fuliginis ATCC 27551]